LSSSLVQRWRVPLGFVCAAIFLLLATPRPLTLIVGGVIALFGLGIRAWASGHIRKNVTLANSGPYAFTRNPLYLGSFLLGLGFTIAAGRWVLSVLFGALLLGIYLPVMRVEANDLEKVFGEEYRRYATAVPLFFPRLTPYETPANEATHFDRDLYLKYGEYRAALGFALGWLALAIKSYYLN
jgi:protein-S-isoprenylcysteine O-methyltransferase Ste14